MSTFLFEEFSPISSKAWKQKLQFDLNGADYNNTLLYKTDEDITINPFYTKETTKSAVIDTPNEGFKICQSIFIDKEKIANTIALNAQKKGATSIQFIANKPFDYKEVLKNLNLSNIELHFTLHFLNDLFVKEVNEFTKNETPYFHTDIIGNLATTGNWYINRKEDFSTLQSIIEQTENSITIDGALYQNAGASMIQQLAFTLAHANEYLNFYNEEVASKIQIKFAVGGNYFFEIAKIRAFRILWKTLLGEDNSVTTSIPIFVEPSLRNKTIYDYNLNMIRTTSECMSGILGGANTICNIAYDVLFHKSNEFGERIARNQLLILQQETHLAAAQEYANGSYYIEYLTLELAEKALTLFKQIEKNGGFLQQLKVGTIQKKIKEKAKKEEEKFNSKEIVLVGTNFQPNSKEIMNQDLELYPFLKMKHRKTLITPILKKRLSESIEKERLNSEKQ